jgi:protein tyrosine phosphatase (PTP) superfamily phosphohydrolase (DUF442 family)
MAVAKLGKRTRRAIKRVTFGWRVSLLDNSPQWLSKAVGKPVSYLDMLLVDHGIFRLVYSNRHALDGRAWRSAQPAPHHIRALAHQGIKTIVNLRGERLCGSYWLERAACERYGIKLVNFQVRSRAAPSRDEVRQASELFRTIEYPMLMHCKSGADRAGLMSVLYAHFQRGVPMSEATKQLSLRYGHIRQADTGILDAFFEKYVAYNAVTPIAFLDWVETVYDADELKRTFLAKGWANRLVNSVLRRE